MKRRISAWKSPAVLAGTPALPALAVRRVGRAPAAGSALERHAREAARTIAEVRARNFRRPPLFGAALPGTAAQANRFVTLSDEAATWTVRRR